MNALPTLIFCGGNNPHFARIAIDSGFKYGSRLPCDKPFFEIYFADQDWRNPERISYMKALEKYRPKIATVIDYERDEQFCEVVGWAEEASQFVENVVIIPKIADARKIPNQINGKEIILGYSVPTSHGHTNTPINHFYGRKVHLLGGSPEKQYKIFRYLSQFSEVVSVDGNLHLKLANRGLVWLGGGVRKSLKEIDGERYNGNGNFEAFRRSSLNIYQMWGQ